MIYYRSVVMVTVTSVWIITPAFVLVYVPSSFLTPAVPEHQPTHRGRATVPRPPHTAALGVPGERTGAAAKLGERRASIVEVALPGLANITLFLILGQW